jgi:hypothetical protein
MKKLNTLAAKKMPNKKLAIPCPNHCGKTFGARELRTLLARHLRDCPKRPKVTRTVLVFKGEELELKPPGKRRKEGKEKR